MTFFKDFKLHPLIIKAIEDAEFTTPTPIQKQAIPKVLENFDLFASAQTGTGKTAAFILPALNKLMSPSPVKGRGPRILVVVPTRELAMQVANECVKFSKYLKRVKTICIFGGVPYPPQRRNLSRPYEILIATPGRLIDHLDQGKIDFSRLEMLVLDEADRMLDMGFIAPVKHVAKATPKNRQTLMFSATLNDNVLKLSTHLLNNPEKINVTPKKVSLDHIEQQLHKVDSLKHKKLLLAHILNDQKITQAIIFTSTKSYANQLTEELNKRGHYAAALHGDIKQRQRTRTITQFRNNKIRLLVATDVASRGIDILNVSHVINFDLPQQAEDYIHRIGRTGRAGAQGYAISFAANKDRLMLKQIEKFLGQKMKSVLIENLTIKTSENFSDHKKFFSKPFEKRSFKKPLVQKQNKNNPKTRKKFGKFNKKKSFAKKKASSFYS